MLTLYEIDMLRIAQKLVIGVDEEQEQDEKLPIVAFYLKNKQHFLDPVVSFSTGSFDNESCAQAGYCDKQMRSYIQ